ncbi:MAG: hypothetical protein WBQ50_16080 [Nocardioides sp.]
MTPAPVSDYRLSMAVAVRMSGLAVAVGGVAIVVAAILVATVGVPRGVLSIVVLLGVGLLLGSVALAVRRVTVVRLDEQGYRVRFVRGAGVTQGRWKDVEDVVATTVAGDRCVVLRRRDGATTTIPVGILEAGSRDFVQDLQQHLNRGHGYRPVT